MTDHDHDGPDDQHHHEDDAHHHGSDDDHHEHDAAAVSLAVLTISTSRTLESDSSGDAIVEALEDGGHEVVTRDLVTDSEEAIRSRVREFASNEAVGAVVTTGGTGLAPTDVTPEAVRPLFDREMPGFGEVFRTQSVAQAGPHAMLTRATAGIHGTLPIFCLPGSESAARFGTSELVVPVLGHVVGLLDGGTHD